MAVQPAIQKYFDDTKARNDRLNNAIDGVVGDVKALKAKIDELQNSPGAISAEDQELLDQLQQQADSLVAKAEALDNETGQAPVPPVV